MRATLIASSPERFKTGATKALLAKAGLDGGERNEFSGCNLLSLARDSLHAIGQSAAFRQFIRTDLMPIIETRYGVTSEAAIIGESLAGLFVVETCLYEPSLFDTYIAFDPSLWWNDSHLLAEARPRLATGDHEGTVRYLATSSEVEIANLARRLTAALEDAAPAGVTWDYHSMPQESHGTIYHPAALAAFRRVFKPAG